MSAARALRRLLTLRRLAWRGQPALIDSQTAESRDEALACSGRATTASARAQAFVRDYPTSPHASKVHHFTR